MGLNAAGGNIGVSVVQAIVPIVIGVGIFSSMTGGSQTTESGEEIFAQNAAFIWVPLILIALVGTYLFQNNLHVQKASFAEQSIIFKRKHT